MSDRKYCPHDITEGTCVKCYDRLKEKLRQTHCSGHAEHVVRTEGLRLQIDKLVSALEKIESDKRMTIMHESEEFMDGAHSAYIRQAEVATEALEEYRKWKDGK